MRCLLFGSCGCGMTLLVGLAASGAVADEPRRPPAGLLPASGLTFYLEFDGLKAHEPAWNGTAAHDVLVKTSSGSTILEVERQTFETLFRAAFPSSKITGAGFVGLQDHLVARGFAVGSHVEDGESSTVFLLNGLGDDGGIGRFEAILQGFLRMETDAALPMPTRLRNRELRGFGAWNAADPPLTQSALTWWREGDTLIVVDGPRAGPFDGILHPERAGKDLPAIHRSRVTSVLDAIDGQRPNATTHPAYLASKTEGGDLAGFEPTGLLFAEAKDGQGVLQALSKTMAAQGGVDEFAFFQSLDLSRAGRIVGRWGFRGKSLVTDLRFSYPDAWNGPLQVPGFSKDRLPPIPQAPGILAIGSIDQTRVVERLGWLPAAMNPEPKAIFSAMVEAIREASTPQVREELLRHLGPTWSVYAGPGSGDDPNPQASPVFVVEYHDADGLDKALEALASAINAYFRAKLGDPGDLKAPTIALERLPAPDRGYRLTSPPGLIPWLTGRVQPTLLIGRSSLVVALNPDQAKAVLAAESKPEARLTPRGELAKSLEALPAQLVFLSIGNPRDSGWPETLVGFRQSAPGFLGKLLRFDFRGVAAPDPKPDLLDVLGVPKGARVDLPRVDDLRAAIHPSVLAASVEDRSFRLIVLEALPFGCLGFETKWSPQGAMNLEMMKFHPGR